MSKKNHMMFWLFVLLVGVCTIAVWCGHRASEVASAIGVHNEGVIGDVVGILAMLVMVGASRTAPSSRENACPAKAPDEPAGSTGHEDQG